MLDRPPHGICKEYSWVERCISITLLPGWIKTPPSYVTIFVVICHPEHYVHRWRMSFFRGKEGWDLGYALLMILISGLANVALVVVTRRPRVLESGVHH